MNERRQWRLSYTLLYAYPYERDTEKNIFTSTFQIERYIQHTNLIVYFTLCSHLNLCIEK